jgi:hypothetical protein
MQSFWKRDENFLPRMKQMRSFCQMPWMSDRKIFMSEGSLLEPMFPPVSPTGRLTSLTGSNTQEDQTFSSVRVHQILHQTLRPAISEAPGQRMDTDALKLLPAWVNDRKKLETGKKSPAPQPDPSDRNIIF